MAGRRVILALITRSPDAPSKLLLIGVYLQGACSWSAKATFARAIAVFSLLRLCIALSLLFVSACSQSTVPAPAPSVSESGVFQGTWSASGSRHTIHLETDHRASIFDLTGSLVLTGERGLGVGFRAKAIGFTDSRTGMQGSCVWTDERGDKVYSELKGEMVGPGNRITGRFLGGTGRFAGVTGEYSFAWRYVVETEDGALSGRAVNLVGRAQLASSGATSFGEHSQ